jgi:hypothetical protein
MPSIGLGRTGTSHELSHENEDSSHESNYIQKDENLRANQSIKKMIQQKEFNVDIQDEDLIRYLGSRLGCFSSSYLHHLYPLENIKLHLSPFEYQL